MPAKLLGPIGLLLLIILTHASAAYGASISASPSDPPAGSPAAAMYELPFEKGRADAAPQGSGGTSAGDSPGAEGSEDDEGEASFYRSENNFGSSSQVPGDSPPDGEGDGEGVIGSAGGAGSDGSGGGDPAGTFESAAGSAAHVADSGNTSPAANIALLAVIGAIVAGVGFFSVRASRLRTLQ